MAEAVYGYAENKKSLLTRLARAEGRGVSRMMTTSTASTSSPRSAPPKRR
jgi:hypothetical protein